MLVSLVTNASCPIYPPKKDIVYNCADRAVILFKSKIYLNLNFQLLNYNITKILT